MTKTPTTKGVYAPKLFNKICERLAEGRILSDVCGDEDIPVTESQARRWVVKDIDGAAEAFQRARDQGLDRMADGLISMTADLVKQGIFISTELVAAVRLHVDAVKWYLSKRGPKRYGEARLLDDGQGGPVYLIGLLVDARARLADAAQSAIDVTPK